MSERRPDPGPDEDKPQPGESFLSRFHRRKTEARLAAAIPQETVPTQQAEHSDPAVAAASAEPAAEEELTDADMPPLESLDASSDYTGFLSPKVSESLRRAALRKLFHGTAFNVIDELDDYAEDFTSFEALGNIITADMRHQIEVEAKKKAEALKKALLEDEEGAVEHDDEIGEEQPPTAELAESPSDAEPVKPTDTPAESLEPESRITHARTR